MARITVEDCLKKVPNRFALAIAASHRVKQLREGAKPLVNSPENREVVIALREVAAGKVKPDRDVSKVKNIKEESEHASKR